MKNVVKSLILMIMIMFILATTVQAMSVNLETNLTELKVNEEINVKVILDESIVTSDFKLKYDSESFEFVNTETEYLHVKNYVNYGYVASVYANLEGKGTKEFDFKFKATKQVKNAIFEITDMNCTTENSDVYDDSNLEQNYKSNVVKVITSITPNDQDNPSNIDNNENKIEKNSINGKDGTVANGMLPYAGVQTIIIIAIVFFIILAIFFKKREKILKKILSVFVAGIIITSVSNINNSYAYTQTIKIFKLDNQTDNIDIYSIILNTVDTEKKVTASELKEIITNIDEIKTKDDNLIEDNDLIGTGAIISLKDDFQSKIILYGDTTGEGKINSNDIYAMIQHMLNKSKLTGIYAKAVNLSNKDDFNDERIDEDDVYKYIDFLLGILETDLVEELPEGTKDLSQYIDVKFANQEDENLQAGDKCGFYIVLGEQTPKAHCKVIKTLEETETVLLDSDIAETKAYQVEVEENAEYEINVTIVDDNNAIISSVTAKINMIPYLETEEGAKIKNDTIAAVSNETEGIEAEAAESIQALKERKRNIQDEVENEKCKRENEKAIQENEIRTDANDKLNIIEEEYNKTIENIDKALNDGSIDTQEANNRIDEAQRQKEEAQLSIDMQMNLQLEDLNRSFNQSIQQLDEKLEDEERAIENEIENVLREKTQRIENIQNTANEKLQELGKFIVIQKLK